jgi:hypothetical protein
MTKPCKKRLLLAGEIVGRQPPGGGGYAVCVGDVPRPKLRCEWRVIAFYKKLDVAERAMRKIEPSLGRAVFTLGGEDVVLVSRDDPVDPLKVFRREVLAVVGNPHAIEVPIGGDHQDSQETATVLAYPVGEHFAVHKTVEEGFESRWTATHLPSKLGAGTKHKNKTIAVAIALTMQRLPLPWSSPKLKNTAANHVVWKRALAIASMESLDEVRAAAEQELLLS